MLLPLTFTTPSMAPFTAVFGPFAILAPGPKYAASATSRHLATYTKSILNKTAFDYCLTLFFKLLMLSGSARLFKAIFGPSFFLYFTMPYLI